MQATVVTLVMSASLILDKLNNLLMFANSNSHDKTTNTPYTTPCDIQPSESNSPDLAQVKLVTGCIKKFTVPSAASPQYCKEVTWKKSRLEYTKLFEMNI